MSKTSLKSGILETQRMPGCQIALFHISQRDLSFFKRDQDFALLKDDLPFVTINSAEFYNGKNGIKLTQFDGEILSFKIRGEHLTLNRCISILVSAADN